MADNTPAPSQGQEPSQPANAQGSAASQAGSSTVLGNDQSSQTAAPGATQPNQGESKQGEQGAKPGEKPGEAKGDDKGSQQAKAPERYEFKPPQGMELDTQAVEAFSPVMRELNLTQEQAQKLVDVYAARISEQTKGFEKQLSENEDFAVQQAGEMLAPHREKWAAALKADKEIGGTNFDANVQVAQKAIARFGSPALKAALNATGLGNHPEFVRFCLKVGRGISEDHPTLQGQGGGRKAAEDVFYGGQAAS